MGRKRKATVPPVLLGPDGKPYVAPPPKPEPVAAGPETAVYVDVPSYAGTALDYLVATTMARYRTTDGITVNFGHAKSAPTLADAVAREVEAMTADLDGPVAPELPTPDRDLTAYADAFDSAAKNCNHQHTTELLYGREWLCEDCRRIIGVEEYRKHRSSIFGWMG